MPAGKNTWLWDFELCLYKECTQLISFKTKVCFLLLSTYSSKFAGRQLAYFQINLLCKLYSEDSCVGNKKKRNGHGGVIMEKLWFITNKIKKLWNIMETWSFLICMVIITFIFPFSCFSPKKTKKQKQKTKKKPICWQLFTSCLFVCLFVCWILNIFFCICYFIYKLKTRL